MCQSYVHPGHFLGSGRYFLKRLSTSAPVSMPCVYTTLSALSPRGHRRPAAQWKSMVPALCIRDIEAFVFLTCSFPATHQFSASIILWLLSSSCYLCPRESVSPFCIYLFERPRAREKEIFESSCFTAQMPTTARTEPGQGEPCNSTRVSVGMG